MPVRTRRLRLGRSRLRERRRGGLRIAPLRALGSATRSRSTARAQENAGERVGEVGVEAGGHEYQLRAKAADSRRADFVVAGAVSVIARTRGERDIDGGAFAIAGADLRPVAGARVVRELMRGEVGYAGVVVGDVLGAVAVGAVDVDDRHAIDPPLLERPGRGDCDVVEAVEAHWAVWRSLMAWW